MIESIIINNKAYFFSMRSPHQIQDITKFCCPESDGSVLGIDKRFNLHDLWVTDSCYKDTWIVNRATGNHQVFLGPLMFHFTRGKSTFSCIALQMMAVANDWHQHKWVNLQRFQSLDSGSKSAVLCSSLGSTWWKKNLDGLFGKANVVYREEITPRTESWKIYTVMRKAHMKGSVW